MKDPISITVPFEYFALTRASDFLHGLAQDAKVAGEPDYGSDYSDIDADRSHIEAKIPASQGGTMPDCSEKIQRHVDVASGSVAEFKARAEANFPETAGLDDTGPADRDPSDAFGSAAAVAGPSDAVPPAAAVSGVTVDSDGLPWDGRIHSGSKATLAKTKQWKNRRKPGDQTEDQWGQYVASVETELRQVMQAGPSNPIVPAGPATPTPPPVAAVTPTPPLAAADAIASLPALFRYITDNNVTDERVLAAINSQGIESLPLLGARPDLIPAVAAMLQGG